MNEQENLRIVQDGYAAFAHGDVAAALSNYSDDIDWAMPGSPNIFPYAGQRRGREQVAQFYSTFAQTEEVEQMELQDFIHVVTLRDGKVIKFREYSASDDMYAAFAGR